MPTAGFGLFTSTSFAKGAPICEDLGECIDDWTLGRRYDGKASPYALRYGRSSIYVDALGQRSLGSTANNSKHPNAEYTVLASVKAIQAAAGGRRIEHATPGLWLTASVAIASNREIFTAYVDGNDDGDSTDVDWWGADDDVEYEVPLNATWTTWKAVLPRGLSAPSVVSPLNDAARASVDGEYAPPTGNPRTAREDLKKHVLMAAARDKSSTVFARHSWYVLQEGRVRGRVCVGRTVVHALCVVPCASQVWYIISTLRRTSSRRYIRSDGGVGFRSGTGARV